MVDKTTIAWRLGVLAMCAAAVPAALYWQDSRRHVDTEGMLDASVSIKTISHVEIDAVGDSVWSTTSGSGFLMSSRDCEVLTNHHVVADAARIEIYPRKWTKPVGIPARVVNSSPRTDIAILQVDSCDHISAAPLGESDRLRPGDEVYAVGNPLGINPDSISQGIVSHTRRFTSASIPYLQTDANISRGSSGGALFNRWGEVVGVNTAIASMPNGDHLGVAYALPINLVRKEIQRLRAGPPSWGHAGIEEHLTGLTEREAAFFNVPPGRAAVIVTASPGEGPSRGKLFAKDVIYEIDDTPLVDTRHAKQIISGYAPGDDVVFKVMRSGEPLELGVTLEEGWRAEDAPAADYYSGHLGLSMEMWNADTENKFESPIITQVSSLGPAHLARIKSSQKTLLRSGPGVIPIQLEVKTVTGVVYETRYRSVESVAALEQLAARAFIDGRPLLLEIETWGRSNPVKFREPIQLLSTTFHSVLPALSTAEAPPVEDADAAGVAAAPVASNPYHAAHSDREMSFD